MTDKLNNQSASIPRTNGENDDDQVKTVSFDYPNRLLGQTLDSRFLIKTNLQDNGADKGGMGLVYLAEDLKLLNKEVVVKILQRTVLEDKDMVRKFLHEKEALIRLDHPNIVRILDHGTLSDGNPFLVIEYIKGHSLRKELAEKHQLSLNAVAHVIECVSDALSAAHAEKIFHRDIKPANIMVTPQEDGPDRIRLIDFGIARVEESKLAPMTITKGLVGTPYYMAPEQLVGGRDLTPATDTYATAIVAYQMLTGDLPFKPRSIAEMYQLEKEGVKIAPRQLRPDLSHEAERIILAALEFDPAKRPQSAKTFGRDLAAALRMASPIDDQDTIRTFSNLTTERESLISLVTRERQGKVNWLKWLVVAGIAALLLIPSGYLLNRGMTSLRVGEQGLEPPSTQTPESDRRVSGPADAGEPHELSYFLMVQKMRNGRPFEAPFKSSGQEIYESGDKFSMTFQPDADGFMYLFNEGKNENNGADYYLLFPSASVNNGSPKVYAKLDVQTARNTVSGRPGTEVMWLIWTKKQRDDLEAIVRSVTVPPGRVKPEHKGILRDFLDAYKGRAESGKDSENQKTTFKAQGDVVVHRFELEHR